jgi:ubiquinone/menaquinone biosynthesis C-methylase UbiE
MAFRPDLYRGTAEYYDKFRVPYPQALINDLSERIVLSGSSTLLDLACGPGTVAFALRDRFTQVVAVDQEPDMIAVARAKADPASAAWSAQQKSSPLPQLPSTWSRSATRSIGSPVKP